MMQQIYSALKQAFHRSILLLVMLSFLSLSGLFIAQPSLAAPISPEGQKLIQQEKMDRASQVANQREQAYEEQVEAAKDPDKVYEENLKADKGSNSDENLVEKAVEGAKAAIENVTGK
jgi:hypothetical protein